MHAAGAVVTRKGGEVLLVHRPRYDDWAFPKGKLDRGEHVTAAAVREVGEETGLRIRLAAPLPAQTYPVGRGTKHVDYWVGRVVGEDDVSGYQPNNEIDDVRWVPWREATTVLTYDRDRETLAQAREVRRRTAALVVLRHAKARDRKTWRGDDRDRPLLQEGLVQSQRLVPMLAAFGISEVHTSSSERCRQTVSPYRHASDGQLQEHDFLSEEGESAPAIDDLMESLLGEKTSAVVCSHRPVLPTMFEALGLEPVSLNPGEMYVVHHRAARLVAVERHRPVG